MASPIPASVITADRKKRRERYIRHLRNLMTFSNFTLHCLALVDRGTFPRDRVEAYYKEWHKCFIIDYNMHSGETAHGMFAALCQANFVLQYERIVRETKYIADLGKFPEGDDLLVRRFLHDTDNDPIQMFGQSEIMDGLLYITEQINHIPADKIEWLEKRHEALFTRCSVLFCEHNTEQLFDVPSMRERDDDGEYRPNEAFLVYCTIYFNAIQRRLFYYHLVERCFQSELPPLDPGRFKTFLEGPVCKFLGSDSIEDLYTKACDEAYEFPGDRAWYKYVYPAIDASRGAVLQHTRTLYAESYRTESHVSRRPILVGVSDGGHRGYCCRTFVLEAFDRYISAYAGCNNWKSCVAISNSQLSTAEGQAKLMQGQMPLLVQITSRYWVYSKASIWRTDCIYEAIACWCYILKRDYEGQLLDRDFNLFIDKILE